MNGEFFAGNLNDKILSTHMSNFSAIDELIIEYLRIAAYSLSSTIAIEDHSGEYTNRQGFVIHKEVQMSTLGEFSLSVELISRENEQGKLRFNLLTKERQIATLRLIEPQLQSVYEALEDLTQYVQKLESLIQTSGASRK
jgi:hypothetical protein